MPSDRLASQERYLSANTSRPICVNLSHANCAKKNRPLAMKMLRMIIITTAYEVRMFYLAVIYMKIVIMSCIYYYESRQLGLYY